MEFDSTFWVAISFVIFFGVLIYFKIPRKINEALDTKISEIKNELDESEKLRIETKKCSRRHNRKNPLVRYKLRYLLFRNVVWLDCFPLCFIQHIQKSVR